MSTNRNLSLVILALMALLAFAGCTREITTVVSETPEPASCFECHSDQNTFLVAIENQWSNSVHASGTNTSRNSASCSKCHTSEGFLQFVAGETPTTISNPTVIHCFTCHAPHSEQDFGLRLMTPATLANGASEDIGMGNLCASCHQARRAFATYFNGTINSTHWGPHYGTQADMLFASNGYEYAGYTYNDTQWHRTMTQDGCVDCHVRTGGQNWVVGGHSFNMRATIEDEGGDPTEIITTESCKNCHDPFGSNFDFNMVQTEVDSLLGALLVTLQTAGVMDATGHPIASTATVPADLAGAVWNYRAVHDDRSQGVHNPDYILSLLRSSLDYMNAPGK